MKKRSFLQRMLANNQVLFVLSVIISLGIWIYMSTGTSNDTVVTVGDIPIQVALPDEAVNNGLTTYFSGEDTAYASVTVSGNRKLLGSITKDDFIVTANASSVDRAGTFNLAVSADKKSSINNFQITNCTPSKISVKVDTESKKDFKIIPRFKYSANDNNYAYISYENDTITVSGPSEDVRKIAKVCAVTDDMENLSESKDFTAQIVLYDESDKELSQTYLTVSEKTVKGKVNISPQKTVDVKATFKNKPRDLNVTDDILTIDPGRVSVAGSEEDLKRVYYVSLDEIDFSTLKNEKRDFDSLQPSIPDGCKIIDNNSVFKVTLDLSGFSSKTITVEKFKIKDLSSEYKGEVTTKNLKVTFYGPKSDLSKLSSDNVTAVVNASELSGNTGAQDLPVSFDLGDNKTCWAYGSHLASTTIESK